MDLQDKVVVVTGASSGLGRAFSQAIAEKGAQVYGLARSTDKLADVQSAIGERFHPVPCDVREEEQVKKAFGQIIDEAGRLDVLINNAGLGKYGPVDELELGEWDVQMETNLRGVFLATRAVLPQMKKQNEASGFGGYVINIASIAGLLGNPNLSAYNASKFGLRGFSEALMKEVREDGIKVSCVYPGSIDTGFSNTSGGGGSANPMTPEQITSTILHLLETPDNYLISEVVMRPLRPKG